MPKFREHESIPFSHPYGEAVGRGKDNVVVKLGKKATRTGLVLKWNHDYRGEQPSTKEIYNRLAYKKNKYEILKAFLGDFIPDSSFVLGTKTDGTKVKKKEFIVQQRVPNFRLRDLTAEQLQDPKLRANMGLLLSKLENMYLALGMVNARTGTSKANLDGKLDLGGVSNYARQFVESGHTEEDVENVLLSDKILDSPNICVDPGSLDIFCVDFDKGNWSPDKQGAKEVLFDLMASRPEIRERAQMTVEQYQAVHPIGKVA